MKKLSLKPMPWNKNKNFIVDVTINRTGYQSKNRRLKNYSSSFYCSFYWATLTFGYVSYSSSTTYAANEDNKEENTFHGYSCLFVWNCRLYWAADCLHACTIYGLAKSRFQFAHAMLACSWLSVSEDNRKSERATSRISCERDPGVERRG